MIKQQQQTSTESLNYSNLNNNSSILGRRNSQSFKQRINRLKAKIKPCIILPQSLPHSPAAMSQQKLNNTMAKPSLTLQKQEKSDRILSETKVVSMRVSYRKQSLVFKTKFKDRKQTNQMEGKHIHIKNQHSLSIKLNLNFLQEMKKQENFEAQRKNSRKCTKNKQNEQQNGCEIEDILIYTYKSPITTQRAKLKTKAQKSFRKTTIDVRQCSARNTTEYNFNIRKDKTSRGGMVSEQFTSRHLKTQSHFYKIK